MATMYITWSPDDTIKNPALDDLRLMLQITRFNIVRRLANRNLRRLATWESEDDGTHELAIKGVSPETIVDFATELREQWGITGLVIDAATPQESTILAGLAPWFTIVDNYRVEGDVAS